MRTPPSCSSTPARHDLDRRGGRAGSRSPSPHGAAERLDELAPQAKLRGIRHLIHDEPDPHWIFKPTVLESVQASRGAGPDPRGAGRLPTSPRRHPRRWQRLFPRLTIVDRSPREAAARSRSPMAPGRSCSAMPAAHPNVAAKISGLEHRHAAARTGAPHDLRAVRSMRRSPRSAPSGCSAAATGPSRCSTVTTVASGSETRQGRSASVAPDRCRGAARRHGPERLYRLESRTGAPPLAHSATVVNGMALTDQAIEKIKDLIVGGRIRARCQASAARASSPSGSGSRGTRCERPCAP